MTSTSTSKYDWYATVTGRVGYAWDNWLVYGKGGAAFARVEYGGSSFVPGPGTFVVNPTNDTLSGWTVGGGVEFGFLKSWSAKAEYNYLDFGTTQRVFVTTTGAVGPATNYETHVHAFKVGLNYRFGEF
jgi:outer membrane immunogenic protein